MGLPASLAHLKGITFMGLLDLSSLSESPSVAPLTADSIRAVRAKSGGPLKRPLWIRSMPDKSHIGGILKLYDLFSKRIKGKSRQSESELHR